MKTIRLGAIDIGSGSVRLLICDVFDAGGQPFFKKNTMIRTPLLLGEDTFSTGFISNIKKEKLALLLASYKSLLEVYDVERWRVCATSALREASNKSEIIDYVFSESGIDIHVIDTEEESRYLLLNYAEQPIDNTRACLFADIGGGSTQLVLYYQGRKIAFESFRLGTIRCQTVTSENEEWIRLRQWIKDHTHSFAKMLLIGSGGNINKVDSLLRRKGRVKREELIAFLNKIRTMSVEERVMNYNMNINRATEIIPAIQIYLKVMKAAKVLAVETPIIGVSDGIIRDLYLKRPDLMNTEL